MTSEGGVGWLLPFAAGAVSFLSPCVLALVPGYIALISGIAVEDLERGVPGQTWRVLSRSVLFIIGFATVFVLLGATASAAGALLLEYRAALNKVAGIFIMFMGLHLTGIVRLDPLYRQWGLLVDPRNLGALGTLFAGMAFAFAWTPCVGPILASILAYAGSVGTVTTGAALLAVYAAGLGIPLLLAGLGLTRGMGALRWLRRHGRGIERASGVVLAGVGVLLFTNKLFYVSILAQRLFSRLGLDLWRFL
ncbi:MAG: cytochrome c biogenesis protein CcdA [Armatimonadetes bacterium]|nr:cytochrome c biogenesis protein CcdA [Armatimonadota bacterium]